MTRKSTKAKSNGALTNGDLWDAHVMIADLSERIYTQVARVSPKASYGLSRNRRLLKPIADSIIDARKEILRECEALDEHGEPKTKNNGKEFDIPKEHKGKFADGWKDLRAVLAGFDPYMVPFEYFDDAVGIAPPYFDAMLAIGMLAEPIVRKDNDAS